MIEEGTQSLRKPAIALLTDFGLSDPYVGQMKGVIASISPTTPVIDLCHHVPPQRVDIASLFLQSSIRFFPPGTIFVAVVDPGVGTSRRAIMLNIQRTFFIGPDNGIFFPLIRTTTAWKAVQIENPRFRLRNVSFTFHGRDIFAPAAAHLANGVPMESFGRKVNALVPLVAPRAKAEGNKVTGEVIYIDNFGNAWTNITRGLLETLGDLEEHKEELQITAGERRIVGLKDAYLSGAQDAIALINSFDLLEIAIPLSNASEKLGLKPGTPVIVTI